MQVVLALAALVAFASVLFYFGNRGIEQERIERTRIIASKVLAPETNANIVRQRSVPSTAASQPAQGPTEPGAIRANTTPSVMI